jgi:2-polyprenyl-3-methyl-5-hydroxy-6-metoxy-1,4-benzoquinol methylase
MIDVSICPICHSTEWQTTFKVQDHSISKEEFILKDCKGCSLRATNPRPANEALFIYYQSEDYISHSGKGNSLINQIYLIARSYSLKWKLKLINSLSTRGKILDVGCGTGEFLNKLKSDNWIVEGIEPNTIARQKASQLTSSAIHESFENSTGTYDVITLWHVLEHLPNLDENLKNISERLSQTGLLLIAVPNYKSWDGQKYNEHWAGYDVPRHLWHYNQKSMVLLLQKYGFNLAQTIPMKLDAFYVSMLSEKYKRNTSALTNAIRGLINGFKSNRKAKRTGEYSSLIYIAKR